MLQLYTEDTYKVPGEPFFGYLRGGYTQDELRAVDDYAFNMGVEVVPCIQTLGHLGQILQWPRYANLRDTNEVVLTKQPETYEFLERLIATVSAPLRSNRIHIGMDEAYGIGEGRFRTMYGAQEGTSIFVEHLARVHGICVKHGLKPMIWSDMLFCLAAKNNALYAYYDQSNNPADAFNKVEGIPPDIDLVFWDYYHTVPEIYARKIQQHRDLGCSNPWLAGAAWTWSRFWCYLPFSFESNRASLTAAKSPVGRVKSFMLTIWGDEGNECDFFSSLPVLLYVGNHAYTEKLEIDVGFMENSFAAICGGSLGDWMYSSRLDEIPPSDMMDARPQLPSNMSKWILWEDPMLSFMSPQYAALDLESHYTETADRLLDLPGPRSVRYPLNRLLRMPGLLARVLSLKCNLRKRLAEPYRAGDRAALLQVAETRLRPLIEAQRELWLYHRSRWHRIYKPFGWETLELRYGGLSARLQTMYDRIVAYALHQPCSTLRRSLGEEDDNMVDSIPELEEELHCIYENAYTSLLLDYGRVTAPSRLG
ncbi:glycoside hydrolase [Martensiomyces pterosporus]|nr:glycoside hydrolase [Martensiomyces pterosporus]